MAYPSPASTNGPQTPNRNSLRSFLPQLVTDLKGPQIHSPKKPVIAFNRTYFTVLGALALFLCMLCWFTGSIVQRDRIPYTGDVFDDYFGHFAGREVCGFQSRDLYVPPSISGNGVPPHRLYCSNRAKLLEAMSGGGRHGVEAPFVPINCHYRWYSTPEICMILERFDSIVFIGDDLVKSVYAAFNMLLREDLSLGGLKAWELNETERVTCQCDDQLIKPECSSHAVVNSQDVISHDGDDRLKSPYHCSRTPHMFLPITDSPAPEDLHSNFTSLISKDPDAYKPIPVIHSLSLARSLSWSAATATMDEWVTLADASGRNIPFLWLGPNAAGYLKPPAQILTEGNNAVWHYTMVTKDEARIRQLDALGMYNLTVQANSWDGSNYGQKVGLVQAMMVINWLSRIEST